MQRFAYLQPHTPAAAVAALARHPQAVLKAGGVDLLDLLKERILTPLLIVDVSQISDLSGVTLEPASGALRVGALTTVTQLAESEDVRAGWPALTQVAAGAATPQIRNLATIGGNLCQRPRCWYFRQEDYVCRKKGGERCFALEGENRYHAIFANQTCASPHPSAVAVPLLAYNATLQVLGQDGTERTLALADFFLPPEHDVQREHVLAQAEIVTAVTIPRLPEGGSSAYLNLKQKQSFDWPLIEVAVVLSQVGGVVRDARVVLGSVAPVPLRSGAAEKVLRGSAVSESVATQTGWAAAQGATPLAHNGYKVPLLAELVRRAVLKAAGQLASTEEVMTL